MLSVKENLACIFLIKWYKRVKLQGQLKRPYKKRPINTTYFHVCRSEFQKIL